MTLTKIFAFADRLIAMLLLVAAVDCSRTPENYCTAIVLTAAAAMFLISEYLDRPTPLEMLKQTIDEARNAGAQFLMNLTGTDSPDAALRQFVNARKADDDAFAAAVKNQMSPPPAT